MMKMKKNVKEEKKNKMQNYKYFLKLFGLIEVEVTKEQFIKTEMMCGFYPKIEGETATDGFGFDKSGFEVQGRIQK
jgi:hypothetical protein